MAYESTAELYRREYELAKKRAQSAYDSRIAQLATAHRQANRDLEGNLESRGILRSGEGMRNRVALGASEKAAQLAALGEREDAWNRAGLTLAQQLAELSAKGGTTTPTTPTTPTPAPAPAPSPVVTRPVTPTPAPAPATPQPGGPSQTACPPGYWYDPIKKTCVKNSDLPTVGGTPVPPGQTPTETRPPAPGQVGGGASGYPAPGAPIQGPDRRLPNGGAVVDGIYIPPGTIFGPPPKAGGGPNVPKR